MPKAKEISRRRFVKSSAVLLSTAALSGSLSAFANEQKWLIGIYTRPWDKFDYRFALDAMAEAGYRYVGLMTTKSKSRLVISKKTKAEQAARVGEEVKKRGLEVISVWAGNFDVKKSLQNGIDELKRMIENTHLCGAGNLLIGGTGDKELFKTYYEAVAACCDFAQEKGVHLTLKPHGGLNATGPQCRKIIEMVGHENFSLWYDPGNIFYYSDGKLDPAKDAATVDGLVTGLCVKDYLHPKNVLVTPGTGRVDFETVLTTLKKGGFTSGPLVVECLKPGEPKEILSEAKKAREFLENLTKG